MSKRDDVTREWRRLHSEELNDLYSLLNVFRVTRSRRMRWASHAACMGRGGYTGFWWGNLREDGHLEDPGVDVRIILKLILKS